MDTERGRKNYTLTNKQRNNIAAYFMLATFAIAILVYTNVFYEPSRRSKTAEVRDSASANWSKVKQFADTREEDGRADSLYAFNPNKADEETFRRLGIRSRVVRTIINYRNKGEFSTLDAFFKLHGMEKYAYLRDYAYLDQPKPKSAPKQNENVKVVLSPFNPNTADSASLRHLGLTANEVSRLIHYRMKGEIRSVDQLMRLSFMRDHDCLRPYVQIPEKKAVAAQRYDVNDMTEDEAKRVFRLSDKQAATFVKYRNSLGGFYCLEQVGECYVIDSVKFASVRASLDCDTEKVVKLSIHRVAPGDLYHPYMKGKLLYAVRKRLLNGYMIRSFAEIEAMPEYDAAANSRLIHYIDFGE